MEARGRDEDADRSEGVSSSAAESSEYGSSSDDDEQQTLAQRASQMAKPAATKTKRRTRVQRFRKVRPDERCGSCENCLNPQRKKACIVARQRIIEEAKAAEKAGSAPPPPARQRSSPADDPFAQSLTGILSNSGGVTQERHVPLLLQLVKRAKTMAHRTALLVVLQLSSQEVQQQVVAGKLLLELQAWLNEFIADRKQSPVQKMLLCLDKLPVTLAALQPPCELGKIVGRLRKHESFGSPVIEPAKRLVTKWKAMVEHSAKPGASAGAASTKPSAPPSSKPLAASQPSAPPPSKPPPAAGQPPPLDHQGSGNLAQTDDGDLFKGTDKQRSGLKDAVPALKKVVTVKTPSVETSRGKPSAEKAGAMQPATNAQGPAKQQPGAEAAPKSAPAGVTDISKVSASPFAALGSFSSGVTQLGGSVGGGLGELLPVTSAFSTARDRAAAAARRVPSPEPRPRRENRKKVSWPADDTIVGVRWFRKDDPPRAAKVDADMSQPPAAGNAAAGQPPAPMFESAAKKEHLSEAAALRKYRAKEDQERLALDQQLAEMQPSIAWMSPVENDALSDAEIASMPAPPARGEDSTEAARLTERRQQVSPAVQTALSETPDEPTVPADHGSMQHLSTIPRIPLSLESAAAMPQQLEQQQQQQLSSSMHFAPHLGSGVQPGQAQHQQLALGPSPAQGAHTPAVAPDIGVTLAQLAASGILGPGDGSTPQQQADAPAPPQHSRQGGAHGGGGWAAHGQPTGAQQPRRHPSQRPCRYFNTPKGCFMGDRCNFAHIPPPGNNTNKRAAEGPPGWQGGYKRGRT